MTRAVIFDLDDTLYPYERYRQSGFAAVARDLEVRRGLPAEATFATLCRASCAPSRGAEFQALCRACDLPLDDVREMRDIYRTHTPALWPSWDVIPTLRQLRAAGWRLGILTNGTPSVQRAKMASLGVDVLVDAVVCAHEHAAEGKPARVCFDETLRQLGATADISVHVGDDAACDVAGAQAAGLRAIQMWRRGAGRTTADAVVSRIGEVADLLESDRVWEQGHAA